MSASPSSLSTAARQPDGAPERAVLVIGSVELAAHVAEQSQRCLIERARHALEGVWRLGRDDFDAVVVSAETPKLGAVLRALRRVADGARVVVVCPVAKEPVARRALDDGADEYVLLPARSGELEHAIGLAPAVALDLDAAVPPPPEDLGRMLELVRATDGGPDETLRRFAEALRQAFDARGAVVELESRRAQAGDVRELVLQESIVREDRRIGALALAPRARGVYSRDAARRLVEWGRLADTLVGQAAAHAHWRRLAWTDDLTGLHNRRFFEQEFGRVLGDAASRRMRVTLFLFDIDDFKTYNDRYGHQTGDALLCEVAVLLGQCTRKHDVVCRIGGDEFAVIFWDADRPRVPGSQHPSEALALTERLRSRIAEHPFEFLGDDSPGPVTISGGIANYPWDGANAAALIAAADAALLQAKRHGKNGIRLAGPPAD